MAQRKPPKVASSLIHREGGGTGGPTQRLATAALVDDAIPYWQREAARWRRHAARFETLAIELRREVGSYLPTGLRPPAYIDLRSNRYRWFNHMAALYGSWAARAEQRLKVLQETHARPS